MRKPLVVLDAAFGGMENGYAYEGVTEKMVNLEICLRLRSILEEYGVDVRMTRTEDVALTVEQRLAVAEGEVVDLFITWRCDALPEDDSLSGLSVWVGSSDSNSLMDVAEVLGESICESSSQPFMGVYEEDHALLSRPHVPAVRVHGVFLSSVEERKQCSKPEFLQWQAVGAAKGILKILQHKKVLNHNK